MKKILHLKIELSEYSPEILRQFFKMIKNTLGEDWIVIGSPCDPSISEDRQNFYNFDMKQLSKNEFEELLKS